MRKLIGILLLLSLAGCYRHFSGAEDLSDTAREYLKKHSSEDADAKWQKKFIDRLDDMIKNNDALSSQSAAADIVVYDWFADRIGKFKQNGLSPEEKIEICRLYLLYIEKKWKWPAKIDQHLTLENYRKWIASEGITVADKR